MAKCKRNRNKTKRNFTVKTPTANQNYKDTVFRMLFSDRKNLLSLYNAVNQSDYNNPDDLEIVTLENAIYMGMKNDLAFIMDTNLYLYEHQSTYNPNMPLRDLFYICSEYQKLVDKKSLYSSTLQKIPAPNFIEFYVSIVRVSKNLRSAVSGIHATRRIRSVPGIHPASIGPPQYGQSIVCLLFRAVTPSPARRLLPVPAAGCWPLSGRIC